MSILSGTEMITLNGMVIYWREAFERNDAAREPIMEAELASVVHQLGPEKILRIINEYVKDQSW